jgi:hypothetical protein
MAPFCAAELPRELWVYVAGKFDIDARVASQRIGKLDPARWQFLHLLLAARLQRRQFVPGCNMFADVLERDYGIHRSFDAAVRYTFFGYGSYWREYTRLHGEYPDVDQRNSTKTWRLHASSNKFSCYLTNDTDSDRSDMDSDTDMED